jgi:hypothetical protein
MQGENNQSLRQILDFIRFGSVTLLLVHFYSTCHPAFQVWGLTTPITDRLVYNFSRSIPGNDLSKLGALLLLGVSLFGTKGRKSEKLSAGNVLMLLIPGLALFLFSNLLFLLSASDAVIAGAYITVTSVGYLCILNGGAKATRLLRLRFKGDIFNELNETFPQEERRLDNEYSINLPAQYRLKGKTRRSWINIINPFRALAVIGTPGSGKSYFVIRHCISQHITKGFTFFIYDFKFPDLTSIAYNTLLLSSGAYKIAPRFYIINFDDLTRTHRCNVISPDNMHDITDATESSRTLMLSLNREWIKKQGDFFTESPINFTTALFWFLKKYEDGRFCTLPHAIELAQVEYNQLFPVLSLEVEIEVLINPFISAFINGAQEQLEGQIASAKICLARLVSPSLYYVLSGNDFTLDVNNPEHPKLVCVGNNPSKSQTYGAVLSLYIERMLKLVNRKGQQKSCLVFDEFPTVYVNNIDNLIATARSNKVATILGIQDFSQLRKDYGKEQAEVIMNVTGNIISGQVIGETAKQLSERIGKIMQERESISINASDTSLSKSTQLESAIPPARIANLSSGEFVGAVADDPQQRIKLKAFHAEILNDHAAIKAAEEKYVPIPVIRDISDSTVMQNYHQIRQDIKNLIDKEMTRIKSDPSLKHLVEKSSKGQKPNMSL